MEGQEGCHHSHISTQTDQTVLHRNWNTQPKGKASVTVWQHKTFAQWITATSSCPTPCLMNSEVVKSNLDAFAYSFFRPGHGCVLQASEREQRTRGRHCAFPYLFRSLGSNLLRYHMPQYIPAKKAPNSSAFLLRKHQMTLCDWISATLTI